MKLLQHTGRYLLLFAGLSLLIGGGLFYATLRYVVDNEQDELLHESATHFMKRWRPHHKSGLPEKRDSINGKTWQQQGIPNDTIFTLADDVLEIRPATGAQHAPFYRDTHIWNTDEREFEPARQYTFTTADSSGKRYLVTITRSILDREDLLFTILIAVGAMALLFLLAVWWFNRFAARRLWLPFNETLAALVRFNFTGKEALVLPENTTVTEFDALNQAVNTMTRRIANDYESLRTFTGNAAHEIQTPLAVIQSKAELLLQNDRLDENTLSAIADIHRTAYRLSRLNRALLLLHKIENQEFIENIAVDLQAEIIEKLDKLSDNMANKGIHITTDLHPATITMHPALADALLRNLLGNAIKHNLSADGQIHLSLTPDALRIRNTGPALHVPPVQLFERFRKATSSTGDSPGLGLSIVQEIAQFYRFKITYSYADNWHHVTVFFTTT